MITIDLKPGEDLMIGDDIVVSLLKPHTWNGVPDGRAHIGIACPRAYRIGREGPRPKGPVLERLPGVTRRRVGKGGGT